MTDKTKHRAVSVGFALLLHVAVVLGLLLQAPPGGTPPGGTPTGGTPTGGAGADSAPVVMVSLVRLAPPSAATRASDPAPSRPASETRARPGGAAPALDDDGRVRTETAGAEAAQAVSLQPNQAPAMTDSAVLLYRSTLEAYLARYRRYPLDARRDHVEGTVLLHFVLSRDGRVIDAWIAQSSGSASLDDEALSAIARAQPLPAIPVGWPGRLEVTLPIAFGLG